VGHGVEVRTGTAARKVRGGKLLRVRADHDGNTLVGVAITGDFFLYPEEGLSVLEKMLAGAPLHEGDEQMAARIETIMTGSGIVSLGFGPSDLATVIREACR